MPIKLQNGKMVFYNTVNKLGTSFHDDCCCPSCTIWSDDFQGSGALSDLNWHIISGNNVLTSGSLMQYGGLSHVTSIKSNNNIGSAHIEAYVNINNLVVGDEIRLSPQSTEDGSEQVYAFLYKNADDCFTVGVGENGSVLIQSVDSYIYNPSNLHLKVCLSENVVYTNFWTSSSSTWSTIISNVVGNSGDRAAIYSSANGSVLWNSVNFQHYGELDNGLYCPTCSGTTTCTNFYEQWIDDNVECRWNLFYGSYPVVHASYPAGYATLPPGQSAYIGKVNNLRGDNQYQSATTTIGSLGFYGTDGVICQIFCCDDGSLSNGAWAKLERVTVDGAQTFRFSIGVGATTSKTYDYFGWSGEISIRICCEGERISGTCSSSASGSSAISLVDGNIGAPIGKYAGIKFNNNEGLYWKPFLYSRNRNGLEDASCGLCVRCSVQNPVTDVWYDIPCYLLIDVEGIQTPRPPILYLGCTDYNGQFILSYVEGSWTSSTIEDSAMWNIYLLYSNGWYIFVTSTRIDFNDPSGDIYDSTLEWLSDVAVFMRFMGPDWNPSDLYNWNEEDIPRNNLENGQCFGSCRRLDGNTMTWVDCTNPGWENTTCKITNAE